MANRHRGEVTLKANGQTFTLCLTLGALAELEDIYGGADILTIAERFSSGTLAAKDAVNLLKVSMAGGGHKVDDDAIDDMTFDGGMAGLISTLADLLRATFTTGEEVRAAPDKSKMEASNETAPFPGRRF
jgi:tail tube GTA-gp10-like protein